MSFIGQIIQEIRWQFSEVKDSLNNKPGQTRIICHIRKQDYHHNGDQDATHIETLCSISVHSFGTLERAARLFIKPLHSQSMCSQMCSALLTFLLSQTVWLQLQRGIFQPLV